MEDVKWLLRKCGLLILLLLIFVIVGVICWGKMHEEEQKVAEEVWEPPVEIENSEAETEEAENAETVTSQHYWFIPQQSDCLASDEERTIAEYGFVSGRFGSEIYGYCNCRCAKLFFRHYELPATEKLWWSNWAEAVW